MIHEKPVGMPGGFDVLEISSSPFSIFPDVFPNLGQTESDVGEGGLHAQER
jgi:hypothetical protein